VARAALTASSAGEPVIVSDIVACVSFDGETARSPAVPGEERIFRTLPEKAIDHERDYAQENSVFTKLAPGEKRSFEVGHPNYVTRKVVIDGSEPEVIVGLHPKSGSAAPKAASEPVEASP